MKFFICILVMMIRFKVKFPCGHQHSQHPWVHYTCAFNQILSQWLHMHAPVDIIFFVTSGPFTRMSSFFFHTNYPIGAQHRACDQTFYIIIISDYTTLCDPLVFTNKHILHITSYIQPSNQSFIYLLIHVFWYIHIN